MTRNLSACFCCSQKPFHECCEPILQNHYLALTPEALMRSRYSAYVLEQEEYLLSTWDISTRPKALSLQDNRVKWLKLIIHSTDTSTAGEHMGKVDFSAHYINQDQFCILREVSRFTYHSGLWYYLDGKTEVNNKKLARNSLCPCGSGRKFKRCCLNNQEKGITS
jgi:SEC-C motif-containing protein